MKSVNKARKSYGVMKNATIIRDPVHGFIELEPLRAELVETPEMQRLNWVTHNGLAKFVYPGANQTRFEHCLGTSHVAGMMCDRLELKGADRDVVLSAALLHDVGHAPFSHALDGVLPRSHEETGSRLVLGKTKLPDQEESFIPGVLEKYDVSPKEVVKCIQAKSGKKYRNQLISGDVDADRLDYIVRDSWHAGTPSFVDVERVINTMVLENNRIYFLEKGTDALESFLVGRSLMYNALYKHHTKMVADAMLRKAVQRHAEALGDFSLWTEWRLLSALNECSGPGRETVQRLMTRNLYKRAFEVKSARAKSQDVKRLESIVKSEDLFEKRVASKAGVSEDDVIVSFPEASASRVLKIGNEVKVMLITREGEKLPLSKSSGIVSALAKRLEAPHVLLVYSPKELVPRVSKAVKQLV